MPGSTSRPVPVSARPAYPSNIDSSATMPTSPSPRSPFTPLSPTAATAANTPNYFADPISPTTSTPNPSSSHNILTRFTSPTTYRHSSSGSVDRSRSKSPTNYGASPTSATGRPKSYSASSDASAAATTPSGGVSPRLGGPVGGSLDRPPLSRKEKRTSGTYTQVGRNSNDWLFGGVSFRDQVGKVVRRGHGAHDT